MHFAAFSQHHHETAESGKTTTTAESLSDNAKILNFLVSQEGKVQVNIPHVQHMHTLIQVFTYRSMPRVSMTCHHYIWHVEVEIKLQLIYF